MPLLDILNNRFASTDIYMYKSATKVVVSLIINCYKNKIDVLSSYRLVKKLVFLQNALSLLRESDLFHAMCHHWKFKKIWTGILELLLSMHGLYHFTMMEEYYIIGMQYRLLQTVITLHSILCCNTFVILNYWHKNISCAPMIFRLVFKATTFYMGR